MTLQSARDGAWHEIELPTPLSFGGGQAFFIVLGAPKAIAFPAGADKNASVPNNSFYFETSLNKYVPLGTIKGYENGAFLIRAVGTKLGSANQPPIAKAQTSANSAAVNESITFNASQSYDPDGQITQYLWSFGDGTSNNLKVATHAYARAVTPSLGVLLALVVWSVQVPASVLWLRHFRFGPTEWIWRSLTYGHPQPMRVAEAPALAVSA